MARRNDHSREELKELTIKAGQTLIINEGLSGFSARKVAKTIGYTVGTLYNLFNDYDDLLLHINALTLTDLAAALEHAVRPEQTGKSALFALGLAYLQFAEDNHNRWLALFEHKMQKQQPPAWYLERITQLFSVLESQLSDTLRHHPPATIKRQARVLWASVHGICVLGLSDKLTLVGAESTKETLREFIELYSQGIIE